MPIRSFLTVIALFICNSLFAQVPSLPADSIPSAKTPYVPGLRSFTQTAYITILGPSCFAGINYDIRFNGTNKGLGARIGIGIAPDYAETRYDRKTKVTTKFSRPIMATIPFGLNYVMGAKKHFIEFGLGMIYLSDDSLCYDDITTNYTWLGWLGINYRRTVGHHMIMRMGLNTFVSSRYIFPLPVPEWGMGYRF